MALEPEKDIKCKNNIKRQALMIIILFIDCLAHLIDFGKDIE